MLKQRLKGPQLLRNASPDRYRKDELKAKHRNLLENYNESGRQYLSRSVSTETRKSEISDKIRNIDGQFNGAELEDRNSYAKRSSSFNLTSVSHMGSPRKLTGKKHLAMNLLSDILNANSPFSSSQRTVQSGPSLRGSPRKDLCPGIDKAIKLHLHDTKRIHDQRSIHASSTNTLQDKSSVLDSSFSDSRHVWRSANPSLPSLLIEESETDTSKTSRKFRRVAFLILVLREWHSPHTLEKQEYCRWILEKQLGGSSLGSSFSHLQIPGVSQSMFDPDEYKANKMMRMSSKAKIILQKRPEVRTEAEISYAMVALRAIKSIAEFPVRMQAKVAKFGRFESYDTRRVIVRQSHAAQALYFVLFGTVTVAVQSDETQQAKTACFLGRHEVFGELALLNKEKRQAWVISTAYVELLSLDHEIYRQIFVVSGQKNINDPDHEEFMSKLDFLQDWPRNVLLDNTSSMLFCYFKRNSVISHNTSTFDWILIVKSGSVDVFARLPNQDAQLSAITGKALRNHSCFQEKKEADEVSEFIERGSKPNRWRCVYIRASNVHDKKREAFGQPGDRHRRKNKMYRMKVKVSVNNEQEFIDNNENMKPRLTSTRNEEENEGEEEEEILGKRTFFDDLHSKEVGDELSVDPNSRLVRLTTLTHRSVFGVQYTLYDNQPSQSLVSNGADCILVRRDLFLQHMSTPVWRKLKSKYPEFPSVEFMTQSLQNFVNWQNYRSSLLLSLRQSNRRLKECKSQACTTKIL